MNGKESPEQAHYRLQMKKMGLEPAEPLQPFIAQSPDGKRYALPQVHVATIDPTRLSELVEMVAMRAAFVILCTEHDPQEANDILNAARKASMEWGTEQQRKALEAAQAAAKDAEPEIPEGVEFVKA